MSANEIQVVLHKDSIFLAEVGLTLADLYTPEELSQRAVAVKANGGTW